MTPGVYLDLPESQYFAAEALGSSDLKKLVRDPAGWWYQSKHNPRYKPDADTKSRILGRALHALLLEGDEAYAARFAIQPDKTAYPDALETMDEMREVLGRAEVEYKKSSKKADLIAYLKHAGFGDQVWDIIRGKYLEQISDPDVTGIDYRDHIGLQHMAELARDHPDVGPAFDPKVGLSEVSVFWHREGEDDILYRARLDRLTPAYIMDLKSMSNWKGKDPVHAAQRQVVEFEYDIQRVFYDEAREALRKHVAENRVFAGGQPVDFRVMESIAAADHWRWIWLFYQVRNDKSGTAPVIIPRMHLKDPSSEVWKGATEKIEFAIANFRKWRDRFGFDEPWVWSVPFEEWDDADLQGLQYKGVPL